MTSHRILTATCLALLSSTLASADSITLKGGDVLQGTIVAEGDASVTLDHAALGRIEVARAEISSIQRSTPATTVPSFSASTTD